MSRRAALNEYASLEQIEEELLAYSKKRLGLSDSRYERIMLLLPKLARLPDLQEAIRTPQAALSSPGEANLVPMTFYLKYCLPTTPESDMNHNRRLWNGKTLARFKTCSAIGAEIEFPQPSRFRVRGKNPAPGVGAFDAAMERINSGGFARSSTAKRWSTYTHSSEFASACSF